MSVVFNFIIVLGILIFFHELGHFIVARLCGVGVEKFSLGFGPRILGKTVGRTEYRISIVPLGGYVKMLGEEPDAPLPPEDIPYSFTHKHVAKRALIVAAGPMFNILLAILIFVGVLYFVGIPSIRPVVRHVEHNSAAQQAGIHTGDFIQSINGRQVAAWEDIEQAVIKCKGDPLNFEIKRNDDTIAMRVVPQSVDAKNIYGEDITYYDIGIQGYPQVKAIVGEIRQGMPAEKAGLQQGDQIVAIDDEPIELWEQMYDKVTTSKGKTLKFTIQRGDETLIKQITPVEVKDEATVSVDAKSYKIGVGPIDPVLEKDKITLDVGFVEAISKGAAQTWWVVKITGQFLVKLAQQKVSKDAIGGPIRIAFLADQQARAGLVQLLYFIAAISVNLAVINLIPIPVLDGGHILFFAIEAIQRKPVSVRVREMAQQVGVFLLILLMIFVLYNDISYQFFR